MEFRHSDIKFPELSIELPELSVEDKKLLNDIGEIIAGVCHLLTLYGYTDGERKLRLKRRLMEIKEYVEEVLHNEERETN